MSHNPIFTVIDRANELRSAGADVISLAAGEPDTPTPAHIVAAATQALENAENHHYGPAAGQPALREAIAAGIRDSLESSWSPADVVITIGAKQALYLGLHAIVGPGDRVIVARPGWPGHHGAAVAAGAAVDYVEAPAGTGFLVTPQALDAAWTPQTRALVLASPANPTGAVYSAKQWSAIARWAHDRDVWIITDDVYQAFVYDGAHTPLLSAAPHMRELCIMVNSVSKAHAMTGWRVGWLAAPPQIIDDATKMISRTLTHVPQITQVAALEALRGDPKILAATVHTYRERRNRLYGTLNEIPGVDCILPDGGMFVFPSVANVLRANSQGLRSTTEMCTWLLEQAHVAVVPGEAFNAPGHLRMCFAVNDERLDTAAARLRIAFRSLVHTPDLSTSHR
jgi:aspartate aminotransferase